MGCIRDQRGVTLLELMIVVVVFGILLGGMYNMFVAQDRAYHVQGELAEMNQNARIALRIMSDDIRSAGYDPTKIFSAPGAGARIETATATSIVLTRDTDEDGDIDTAPNDTREWIGFRFDGANSQIDLCVGQTACGAWQDFADDIQNLEFRYVYSDGETSDVSGLPSDVDGDDTNDFEDIREVEIQIAAKGDSVVIEGMQPRILTSCVQVRNLALR